ncbi:hypothetical protein CAP35_02560 [Chitinophagaceae bacterium IBVUCB1]|nr:hypothetical protein CAP35_02560 [Chitinophagaceae bacterium IBVUCB1]
MTFSPSEYWNERLKKNFNLVGVGDISMGMAYNKLSYAITRSGLHSIYRKYCADKNGHILDIGSGIGFIITTWRDAGYENIDGSDISTYAVEQLKKAFPAYGFCELDIAKNIDVLNGKKYDYVTCASVLYHIVDNDNWQNALVNIRSAMNIGGTFVFSEGFPVENFDITHQVSRSREHYKQALKAAGFEVVKSMPNYVLMSDPTGTNSLLYKYWWALSVRISRRFPKLAYMWWGCVYPIEWLLTRIKSTTPAQEFWICKAI